LVTPKIIKREQEKKGLKPVFKPKKSPEAGFRALKEGR
jgi:hypothetical protein